MSIQAILFIAMIVATGLMAANNRVKLRWVLLWFVVIVLFRLTQPVITEEGCYGTSECGGQRIMHHEPQL